MSRGPEGTSRRRVALTAPSRPSACASPPPGRPPLPWPSSPSSGPPPHALPSAPCSPRPSSTQQAAQAVTGARTALQPQESAGPGTPAEAEAALPLPALLFEPLRRWARRWPRALIGPVTWKCRSGVAAGRRWSSRLLRASEAPDGDPDSKFLSSGDRRGLGAVGGEA